MDALLHLDRQLFTWINQGWANAFFDWLMPWWREKMTWLPLYVLMLGWLVYRYRSRAWLPALVVIATVSLCDIVSSHVLKPWVARLRPCTDPALVDQVRMLVGCGKAYSFTSSHAANHFGVAVSWILLFRHRMAWVVPVALLWAASIAFGQVYVGVHYPADVLGGALIGSGIAWLVYRLAKLMTPKPIFAAL